MEKENKPFKVIGRDFFMLVLVWGDRRNNVVFLTLISWCSNNTKMFQEKVPQTITHQQTELLI